MGSLRQPDGSVLNRHDLEVEDVVIVLAELL
jgi:hypothetical protein